MRKGLKIVSTVLTVCMAFGLTSGLTGFSVKADETTATQATTEAVQQDPNFVKIGDVKVLSLNQKYDLTLENSEEEYDFEFTAKNSGSLKIENTGSSTMDMLLYNVEKDKTSKAQKLKKKSKMSKTAHLAYFGVQAGKKYCIHLSDASADSVSFKLSLAKIAEKNGIDSATAGVLKKGKKVKGVIGVGETDTEWYRFSASKKQYRLIYTETYQNIGKVKFDIYHMRDGKLKKIKGVRSLKFGKETRGGWKIKLVKGTYYIKVAPADAQSSGTYSIKIK